MMRLNPIHLCCAAAVSLFLILGFTHFGTNEGISGFTGGFSVGDGMRGSMKSIMAKSEAIWEKTVRQRNEVMAKFGDMGLFPATTMPLYFTFPYSVWDLVPASYNCPHEYERIGRMGDGGKWVCGMSAYEKNKKPCILYSFGIQNESSFEQEMLERTNCEIWGYDFSVEKFGPAISEEHKHRTHFNAFGIAGTTDSSKTPPFYTIQDLMAKNGHDYIDILKIDIEYYEFETLNSLKKWTWDQGKDYPIGQMLIEIHLFQWAQELTLPYFVNWWEDALESVGMRATWTEPNLLFVTLKGDDSMPRFAEYSLINVKNPKNKLFW